MAEPREPAPTPRPNLDLEERAIDWTTVVASVAGSGVASYAATAAASHFGAKPPPPPPPPAEPAPQIILPSSFEQDPGT